MTKYSWGGAEQNGMFPEEWKGYFDVELLVHMGLTKEHTMSGDALFFSATVTNLQLSEIRDSQ